MSDFSNLDERRISRAGAYKISTKKYAHASAKLELVNQIISDPQQFAIPNFANLAQYVLNPNITDEELRQFSRGINLQDLMGFVMQNKDSPFFINGLTFISQCLFESKKCKSFFSNQQLVTAYLSFIQSQNQQMIDAGLSFLFAILQDPNPEIVSFLYQNNIVAIIANLPVTVSYIGLYSVLTVFPQEQFSDLLSYLPRLFQTTDPEILIRATDVVDELTDMISAENQEQIQSIFSLFFSNFQNIYQLIVDLHTNSRERSDRINREEHGFLLAISSFNILLKLPQIDPSFLPITIEFIGIELNNKPSLVKKNKEQQKVISMAFRLLAQNASAWPHDGVDTFILANWERLSFDAQSSAFSALISYAEIRGPINPQIAMICETKLEESNPDSVITAMSAIAAMAEANPNNTDMAGLLDSAKDAANELILNDDSSAETIQAAQQFLNLFQ